MYCSGCHDSNALRIARIRLQTAEIWNKNKTWSVNKSILQWVWNYSTRVRSASLRVWIVCACRSEMESCLRWRFRSWWSSLQDGSKSTLNGSDQILISWFGLGFVLSPIGFKTITIVEDEIWPKARGWGAGGRWWHREKSLRQWCGPWHKGNEEGIVVEL